MKQLLATIGLISGLAFAASSQAGFVFIDDDEPEGACYLLPSNNDFRTQLAGQGVDRLCLGQSLGLSGQAGDVEASYWGKEAGYTNSFVWGGGDGFTTGTDGFDPFGPTGSQASAFGGGTEVPVPFGFCASSANLFQCLTNLANDQSELSDEQSIGMWISSDGLTAWLLWDDSGAGPDDDYDDMLVRLVFRESVPVPEPGTLGLLGLGLLGLGMRRRRK